MYGLLHLWYANLVGIVTTTVRWIKLHNQ